MSYILDALKKSEQSRQATAPPSIEPEPVAASFNKFATPERLSIIVLLFVVLVLGVYLWLSAEPSLPSVDIEPIRPVEIEEPPLARVEPESLGPENLVSPVEPSIAPDQADITELYASQSTPEPDSRPALPKSEVKPLPQAIVEPIVAAETTPIDVALPEPVNTIKPKPKASIPFIRDIDWSIKDKVPSIDYSAHIYAPGARKGFVILNGAKKHEGDRLSQGIYVEKIEEDAVVLSYEGLIFKLPAMKSWVNQ